MLAYFVKKNTSNVFLVVAILCLVWLGIQVNLASSSTSDKQTNHTKKKSDQKNDTQTAYVKLSSLPTHIHIQRVSFSRHWIGSDTANQMLNSMSDASLTRYLDNMIPHQRLYRLIDKRTFAKNALRILYQDSLPLTTATQQNRISIGLTASYTATDANTDRVGIEDKLYAHLVTPDPKVHNGKVFVAWIHRDSGEVMLLNVLYLNPNKRKNWVSLKPSSGWQAGHYDVSMYQFDNALTPIAVHSFEIEHVIRDALDEDEWDLDELLDDDNPSDLDDLEQADHPIHQYFET